MSEFVSRVIQLDALTLDIEFYSLIRNQLFNIFNQFKISHWTHKYGPEIDLLIKFLIWKFTLLRKDRTIGQTLLGVKYPSDKGKLKILFLLKALIPYLYERCKVAFRYRSFFNKIEVALKHTENGIKTCEIINFCIFLIQNRYPSLVNRILRLRMLPAHQRVPPSIGYSYQLREMLWHQFADFLMIILPIINIHRLRRYLREWGISSPFKSSIDSVKESGLIVSPQESILKCCICKQDAVIPQRFNNCCFCYYCIKSNTMADSKFKSSTCNHSYS